MSLARQKMVSETKMLFFNYSRTSNVLLTFTSAEIIAISNFL